MSSDGYHGTSNTTTSLHALQKTNRKTKRVDYESEAVKWNDGEGVEREKESTMYAFRIKDIHLGWCIAWFPSLFPFLPPPCNHPPLYLITINIDTDPPVNT